MKFRRRGFHHLGNLGSKLADLQGFATLAQELTQNADDVGNAGWLRFDVRADALVVDNGGVFRSCDYLGQDDCPWLVDPTRGKRCDFHRFAWIGSGDKRLEENATGAFGLGFLTVYQVTDSPELISAGQHWMLNEAANEDERIQICDGCDRCRAASLPATRFILPWARDPNSTLRVGLRAQALPSGGETALSQELRRLLPDAMLFLRNLERIELAENGSSILDIGRYADGPEVIVERDGIVSHWRRFTSSFETKAAALKTTYPDKIEVRRSAEVAVAFGDSDIDGRLFAWLPTQELTGLPCHIQADFYPTNDRKHLLWESDYRSEWNRAALFAAARSMGQQLEDIRDHLGHTRFWGLCKAAEGLKNSPTEHLRYFWAELLPAVRSRKSVYAEGGNWTTPTSAVVFDPVYRDYLPAMKALGIVAVHEDLDSVRNILTGVNGLGVRVLRLSLVNDQLAQLGVSEGTPVDECPPVLRDPGLRRELWSVLDRMLANTSAGSREDRDRLLRLPVTTGSDGRIWSFSRVFRTDTQTHELFDQLSLDIPLTTVDSDLPHLAQLGQALTADVVLTSVEERTTDQWDACPFDRVALLEWFAQHHAEFDRTPGLKARLAAQSLFPTSKGYRPLNELSLPSSFEDHLGLAAVVDAVRVRHLVPFLESLGAKTLSLSEYVTRHLARALEAGPLSPTAHRSLVALLADRIGELQDSPDCKEALASVSFVECRDGSYQRAQDTYFATSALKLLPVASVHIAVVPPERAKSVRALYEWLGVATELRLSDLGTAVTMATSSPPTQTTADVVRTVFRHLSLRLADTEDLPREIAGLARSSWLPAQGDSSRWWSPNELAATFAQDLFASQSAFLDIEHQNTTHGGHLIKLLGIKAYPSVQQVARHLLHCASVGAPVKETLYQRLSDVAWSQDPVIDMLVGSACIYLEGRGYVSPKHVFWTDPGFGKYRYALGDNLRSCGRFLDRVGVRRTPDSSDAIEVLLEIAADPSLKGQIVQGDIASVVNRCWTFLADAFRTGVLLQGSLGVLRDRPVIPDAAGLLNRPDLLFLEDRPNLAAHFRDSLGSNVIPLPELTAAVMEAAGVRRLSRHIDVEVLECEDRDENFFVAGRCKDRTEQLRRAAVAAGHSSPDTDWARLEAITYEATTRLLVRYACDALGRVKYSLPQSPRSVFLSNEKALLVEFSDGRVSWPDVARELSLVVFPDLEPGRTSASFLQVLTPESSADADEILDALGVPRLASQEPADPPPVSTIEGIGMPGTAGEPTFLPPLPTGGNNANPPIVSPHSRKKWKPRSRFVTYVVPEDATPRTPGDCEASVINRETEQAGIRRVKWFEEAKERVVRVMPPGNPGYDIESRVVGGDDVERYIEVKALSQDWGPEGIGLTATEFAHARELGERYWLYVVERATSDDAQIYRIQNPARKTNWFFFDRGWSQAAEPND